ncbi:Glycosyl hydrolases family 2, sugar binding domain [Popillia japonica]|uniref:Glycosyl hydrolases family 2, sugar binding domain n=1 Tax=Popillia japonica TaxID=7064 RepID=A0AAW1JYS7_POPJA
MKRLFLIMLTFLTLIVLPPSIKAGLLYPKPSETRETFLTLIVLPPSIKAGLLYPKPSETRETISLDGIWNFVASPLTDPLIGFRNHWYKRRLTTVDDEVHLMPVR